ncbi:MAG: hypothetical protein ACKO27_08550, partial [Ilumatobacteraceae bacterium]
MSAHRHPRVLAASLSALLVLSAGLVSASCSEDPNDAVTTTAPAGGGADTTTAPTTPLPMGDIVAT